MGPRPKSDSRATAAPTLDGSRSLCACRRRVNHHTRWSLTVFLHDGAPLLHGVAPQSLCGGACLGACQGLQKHGLMLWLHHYIGAQADGIQPGTQEALHGLLRRIDDGLILIETGVEHDRDP